MTYSKLVSPTLLVLFAGLGIAEPACAVTLAPEAESRLVLNQKFGRVVLENGSLVTEGFLMRVHRDIAGMYEVPVSFEWPYVEEDRSATKQPDISLSLQPDQTLSQTLDMFVRESGIALRWERVHGVISIWPPDSALEVENNLDVKVSLKLESVSTWDAFKALADAINVDGIKGRRINIYPHFTSSGMAAPPEFRNDNSITLDLQNISAREAACRIMAMSPLELGYSYANHYDPSLSGTTEPISMMSIQVYRQGRAYNTHEGMPRAELVRYMEESKAMLGEFGSP